MKFIRLVCIALMGITIVNAKPTAAVPRKRNQKPIPSFTQLCKHKESLPKQTKYTVKVLLRKAGTNNCDRAQQKLRKKQILDLSSHKISDLSPLAQLTNLKELYLSYNQISDLSPLSRLTNLNFLFLESNQIGDLSPLSQLTNLTWLFVGENPIKNKTCPVKPESICEFEKNGDELLIPEDVDTIAQLPQL
ncbi:Leucine Rich Repeat (LRR)-containing protein [Rivularia sp. PCC 7116]|uniref:leucine-rich repeat domain-containing protein n=1 Tax=Rivularia sp. PCC 7116 TaxID=373994 RepID=UPI00029EE8D5|nr:leucine-rich repeat domain-containing protein [Rivularia sp. PCC 7116]AFY57599.1 Leucine Rich Repeat (LRR)-containing protein [Rivularia sp. PCC 7116]